MQFWRQNTVESESKFVELIQCIKIHRIWSAIWSDRQCKVSNLNWIWIWIDSRKKWFLQTLPIMQRRTPKISFLCRYLTCQAAFGLGWLTYVRITHIKIGEQTKTNFFSIMNITSKLHSTEPETKYIISGLSCRHC